MKFGKLLLSSENIKYKDNYINYKYLKTLISRIAISNNLKPDDDNKYNDIQSTEVEESNFIETIMKECSKVDVYYNNRRDEYIKKLVYYQNNNDNNNNNDELVEYFNDLENLKVYKDLNYTAIIKILKKHDKKTGLNRKNYILSKLSNFMFINAKNDNIFEKFNIKYKSFKDKYMALLEPTTDIYNHIPIIGKPIKNLYSNYSNYFTFIFGLLLFIELLLLYYFKNPIQSSSGYVTLFFQYYIMDPVIKSWCMYLHNFISSHFWLLICSMCYWYVFNNFLCIIIRAFDRVDGVNMYLFVVAGFAVKSLAKNLIASPRVFWLFEAHNAFYCGTGYSLPSGHSMVSSMTLGFLVMRYKNPIYLFFFFLYAAFVFVNVVYIGTHTVADVVVGWTFGIFLLCVYSYSENIVKSNEAFFRKKSSQLLILVVAILCILFFDILEYMSHSPSFDSSRAWQSNMERVCHMVPGSGSRKMQLHLMFSSTPLIAGVGIAYFLYFNVLPNIEQTWLQCVLQSYIGYEISTRTSRWSRTIMTFLGLPEFRFHLSFFIDPLWVVFGAPFIVYVFLLSLNPIKKMYTNFMKPTFFYGVRIPSSVTLSNPVALKSILNITTAEKLFSDSDSDSSVNNHKHYHFSFLNLWRPLIVLFSILILLIALIAQNYNSSRLSKCSTISPLLPNGTFVAPHIIVGGSPLSGKATQSSYLSSYLNVERVSIALVLNQIVQSNGPNSDIIKKYMSAGELVPDDITLPLVLKHIKNIESENKGWILDDFPKTAAQAELAVNKLKVDAFVFLDVPDSKVLARAAVTVIDPVTSISYNNSDLPNDEGIVGRLINRADNRPDYAEKRLALYYSQISPIIYKFSNKLIRVDGDESKNHVHANILNSLIKFFTKC